MYGAYDSGLCGMVLAPPPDNHCGAHAVSEYTCASGKRTKDARARWHDGAGHDAVPHRTSAPIARRAYSWPPSAERCADKYESESVYGVGRPARTVFCEPRHRCALQPVCHNDRLLDASGTFTIRGNGAKHLKIVVGCLTALDPRGGTQGI